MENYSTTLDNDTTSSRPLSFSFNGQGGDYFILLLKNFFLTAITFGIYGFWAKVEMQKFIYNNMEFEGEQFDFHGTGMERFMGMLKVMGMALGVVAVVGLVSWLTPIAGAILGVVVYIAFIFLVVPMAVHGSLKYNLAKTSWSTVFWGYRGDRKEFIGLYLKNVFLTILTLGIYGSWAIDATRTYITRNTRLGNINFEYKGDGLERLVFNIKWIFIGIFTLGIGFLYMPHAAMKFEMQRTTAYQGNQEIRFDYEATFMEAFMLAMGNLLLIIFTFGLGFSWAMMRTLRFYASKLEIEGGFDANALKQTEVDYDDATGDILEDVLDAGGLF